MTKGRHNEETGHLVPPRGYLVNPIIVNRHADRCGSLEESTGNGGVGGTGTGEVWVVNSLDGMSSNW